MSFFKFSWLLLLIFLFSIIFDNKLLVYGQCLTDQRDLLLQLNQSLSSYQGSAGIGSLITSTPSTLESSYEGSNEIWSEILYSPSRTLKRSSWSLNTDCCSAWIGVDCDKDGHVISLDLSSELLLDGLDNSSSLFELQHLQNLNLADNGFEYNTHIPSGFDRLANLTNLNMSNAGFSGQIPIEISRLTRLVSLDLSRGYFGPTLKLDDPDLGALIRNLSELRVLRLDGIDLSAEGRKWCQAVSSSLPKLQVLSLSGGQLSGPIDKSLLQLQSLYEISLDGNNISSQVPEFFVEFSNLTSLSLSSCGLYGKFPEKLFQLQTVQSLSLADNELLRGSLPEFPQNGSLQRLVLTNTNFSGEIPNSIGNLKLLSYLDLGNCGGFNGEIPNSIGNLKLLSYLDLGNCGFNGSIPASMAKLDQLQYIDLSSNRLTGLLPSSSSGWSKSLTEIKLAHNRLTGPIPPLFWNKKFVKLFNLNLRNNSLNGSISPSLFTLLPSLEKLDLSQNQFTGRLAEFPNGTSPPLLDTLDLSGNKLEGSIPPSIFQLSSLINLSLSSNNFNGTLSLDMFLQKFRNLSRLDFAGNNFSIDIGVANPAMFPQLTRLNLRSCNLSVFPDFLRNQSMLRFLDLSSNQIRGKVPYWIWMSTLEKLNLSKNFLEDLEQPLLASSFLKIFDLMVDLSSNMLQGKNFPLPSLVVPIFLDYSNNKLTNVIPHNISWPIRFFSLSSNNLIGGIPTSICECPDLEVLDLSNNNLSGPIPPCLGNMTSLSVLKLGGNYFHGTIPHMFPEGCSLRTLSLNNNRLVGMVARSLANCTMLQVLDLGNNKINGTFPFWLGNMSNLRVLILRSNRFYGPLRHRRTTNQNFQMLQIIDISSNNFIGNLPLEFFSNLKAMTKCGENHILSSGVELPMLYYDSVTVTSKGLYMELVKILTIFTAIDLSNNGFTGDIPEVLGRLISLSILNISQNALTGGIPPSFGNCTQLESLDLSQNKLSGEIPMQLAGLTFLSVLNLSDNHLVGKIPLGTQIQSFNATSFEGNDGLCGPPLTKECIDKGTDSPRISPASKSVNEFNWMPVSVASGFGVGIGISVCLTTFFGTKVRRSSRH